MAFNEFNAHVLKICKICSQLHLKNSECFVNGMGRETAYETHTGETENGPRSQGLDGELEQYSRGLGARNSL